MSDVLDPMDLLVRANPVPDALLLAPTRGYLPAQRALQHILDQPRPLAAGRRGRQVRSGGPAGGGGRRRLLVAAVVAAVVVIASAAAWVATRGSADPAAVACFAAPSLRADTAEAPGGADGPIEACGAVWRSGAFAGWAGTVPPLAACVLPGGNVGVFPGQPEVCDQLTLPRLATQSGDDNTVVAQLIDDLTVMLTAPKCVDVNVAAGLVRQRLDELGLDGWTLIAPATTSPERPCASIAFDPPVKTITLVPVPRPAGP